MTQTGKFSAFLAAAMLCAGIIPATAQDNEEGFDLAGQRYEPQYVNPVTGKALDHKGIILNPTPQSLQKTGDGCLDISEGLKIKDRKKCFGDLLSDFAGEGKCPVLTVDFGGKAAAKAGTREITGAYSLEVNGKGITVIGYDEAGAWYGLGSLRQLAREGKIPFVSIQDWPDLPFRGVVEGFYGTPWSHEVRLSLIDFYGKFKMNTYVYGPKDDPYHSSPNWRKPYPEDEALKIKELVEACNRNHVNFVQVPDDV